MVKLYSKIGPKGQVLIPKPIREIAGLHPGTRVSLEVKEADVVIEKPALDPIKVFEEISKMGKPIKFVHPHEAHEGEIEHRMKKAGLK